MSAVVVKLLLKESNVSKSESCMIQLMLKSLWKSEECEKNLSVVFTKTGEIIKSMLKVYLTPNKLEKSFKFLNIFSKNFGDRQFPPKKVTRPITQSIFEDPKTQKAVPPKDPNTQKKFHPQHPRNYFHPKTFH